MDFQEFVAGYICYRCCNFCWMQCDLDANIHHPTYTRPTFADSYWELRQTLATLAVGRWCKPAPCHN